jgi:hypothetical protein
MTISLPTTPHISALCYAKADKKHQRRRASLRFIKRRVARATRDLHHREIDRIVTDMMGGFATFTADLADVATSERLPTFHRGCFIYDRDIADL